MIMPLADIMPASRGPSSLGDEGHDLTRFEQVDVLRIGDVTVQNTTFGYATEMNLPYAPRGLMGLGFPQREAVPWNDGADNMYPNFPIQLVNEGITNTVAFSLWLNDISKCYLRDWGSSIMIHETDPNSALTDATTGSILFGGIDRAKYHGELTLLDLWVSPELSLTSVSEFFVMLSGVTAVSDTGADDLGSSAFPMPALLDCGATMSHLPEDLFNEILREVNGTYTQEVDQTAVPCHVSDTSGYFSFEFGGKGGATLNVSISDLVFHDGDRTGVINGVQMCEFGILPVKEGGSISLGDSFLRSAYVVYDLVNEQVAMAPANPYATDSDVVTFASYGASVPFATAAPNSHNITALEEVAISATPTVYSAGAGFTKVPEATSTSDSGNASGSASASSSSKSGSSANRASKALLYGACGVGAVFLMLSGLNL